jgi:hypothetical protein
MCFIATHWSVRGILKESSFGLLRTGHKPGQFKDSPCANRERPGVSAPGRFREKRRLDHEQTWYSQGSRIDFGSGDSCSRRYRGHSCCGDNRSEAGALTTTLQVGSSRLGAFTLSAMVRHPTYRQSSFSCENITERSQDVSVILFLQNDGRFGFAARRWRRGPNSHSVR